MRRLLPRNTEQNHRSVYFYPHHQRFWRTSVPQTILPLPTSHTNFQIKSKGYQVLIQRSKIIQLITMTPSGSTHIILSICAILMAQNEDVKNSAILPSAVLMCSKALSAHRYCTVSVRPHRLDLLHFYFHISTKWAMQFKYLNSLNGLTLDV